MGHQISKSMEVCAGIYHLYFRYPHVFSAHCWYCALTNFANVRILSETLNGGKCSLRFSKAGFRSCLSLQALLELQSLCASDLSGMASNIAVFEPERVYFSGKRRTHASKLPECFCQSERVPPSSIPDITSQKFPVWARTEHSSILCN